MKNQLKTIATAFLFCIALGCSTKDPAPSPASEVAGTYSIQTFILNNRTVGVTKGSVTIAERGDAITISNLSVNGTTYQVSAELNVVKETNGTISIGNGYGIYKNKIIDMRFGVVSGGVENTYQIKGSKL
ncbi:hypothetical protein [Runella sp. SP2]|uniref:hypothetical protein n=1 Tax=Runella sp. SP2 TaxID=2268026 RepID=UPI0013DDD418|nr:hypothetical protein [Runella sp. SP2]